MVESFTDEEIALNRIAYAKAVKDFTPEERQRSKERDMVNSPSHYTNGSIECIDYIKEVLTAAEYIGYLRGNMIKYQHRCRDKGKFQQDLQKVEWYSRRLNEYLDGK